MHSECGWPGILSANACYQELRDNEIGRLIRVEEGRFAASSRNKELPTDKIIEISRPYLAWSVFD